MKTSSDKKYKRKMWLKSFDTVKSLQANLGWTWGKIAWANDMDKSRINVSYNTKNHGKRQFRTNYMNSNWQKKLDKNETNEYWLNEGQDHINSGQKSFQKVK